MSNFGFVSTLSAPILSSCKQSSIIKFETENSAYKDKVANINRGRTGHSRIQPATFKQCLLPSFLNSLCLIGKIEGADSPEQATDEAVTSWFQKCLGSNPKDISERVRSALAVVEFTKCNDDPQGNVADFVLNIISTLDRNNVSSIIKEPKACENLIEQLI